MPTFVCTLSWTDHGIRHIKDAGKRRQSARMLAHDLDITIKDIYVTCGGTDLLVIFTADSDETAAKFALVAGSAGNTRSSTCRAFTEQEFDKILKELPALPKV
jgi:uncharacterized protein with GYD domain